MDDNANTPQATPDAGREMADAENAQRSLLESAEPAGLRRTVAIRLWHHLWHPMFIMNFAEHLRLTLGALKNWAVARLWSALIASILWGIGLWMLHVPLAALWAFLAFFLHLVPYLGPPLALLGPTLSLVLTLSADDLIFPLVWLLGLYLGIMVLDELILQPTLLRRQAKVPWWASILAPIVLGIAIPGWGVLLAPPLVAVVWAYRARKLATPAA